MRQIATAYMADTDEIHEKRELESDSGSDEFVLKRRVTSFFG